MFFNRRRRLVKVLSFDATASCIFQKRLERGTFELPSVAEHGDRVTVDGLRCALVEGGAARSALGSRLVRARRDSRRSAGTLTRKPTRRWSGLCLDHVQRSSRQDQVLIGVDREVILPRPSEYLKPGKLWQFFR